MTGDADAEGRTQADAGEDTGSADGVSELEQADVSDDVQTDAARSEREQADASEREADPERPDDRTGSESKSDPAKTESAMSQPTTDADRPDESSTDLAIRRNLYRAGLALFGLLAVVALFQLYASVNQTIDTFVAREYRSLFRAAFNLAVLLLSGVGISWCVRALTAE